MLKNYHITSLFLVLILYLSATMPILASEHLESLNAKTDEYLDQGELDKALAQGLIAFRESQGEVEVTDEGLHALLNMAKIERLLWFPGRATLILQTNFDATDPKAFAAEPSVLALQHEYGMSLIVSRPELAAKWLEYVKEVRSKIETTTVIELNESSVGLAELSFRIGKHAKAEYFALEALKQSDPTETHSYNIHARSLFVVANVAILRNEKIDQLVSRLSSFIQNSISEVSYTNYYNLQLLDSLAAAYDLSGETIRSVQVQKSVVQGFESRGWKTPRYTVAIGNLGEYYRQQRRYEKAIETFEKALSTTEPHLVPTIQYNLARAEISAFGQETSIKNLKEYIKNLDSHLGYLNPQTIVLWLDLAYAMVEQGDLSRANEVLQTLESRIDKWLVAESRDAISYQARRDLLERFANFYPTYFATLLSDTSFSDREIRAAELLLKWKKRRLREDIDLFELVRRTGGKETQNLLRQISSLKGEYSELVFNSKFEQAKLKRLEAQIDDLTQELRQSSEIFERVESALEGDLARVKSGLAPGQTLVEYQIFDVPVAEGQGRREKYLGAILITANDRPVLLNLGPMSVWYPLVRWVFESQHKRSSDSSSKARRIAYDRLIAPILSELPRTNSLLISGDRDLAQLPFGGFLSAQNKPLVELMEVARVVAGHKRLANTRSQIVPRNGTEIILVGGLNYGDYTDLRYAEVGEFGDIPYSKKEIQQVNDLLGDFFEVTVLTGLEARKSTLENTVQSPWLIHFATHGFYLPDAPNIAQPLMQSGIALSAANSSRSPELGESGILLAAEAQTLNLSGTELVFLAACQTASGEATYSDGLEGLTQAFLIAGSRNVIAAIWPVDDALTNKFVNQFYIAYMELGSVADAFHYTRRTLAKENQDWRMYSSFALFQG